jgi:hypothetical protein
MISLGMLPRIQSRLMREVLAALGILLLIGFTVFYTVAVPFPGVSALVPCIAAMLLIMTGEGGTVVGAALSSRPVVFVGLISYSVYLWHWPLIVLMRLGAVEGVQDKTLRGYFYVVIASLLAGTLSWKFVELPFRSGSLKGTSRRRVFELVAVCTVLFAALGVVFSAAHGMPQRFPPQALAVAEASEPQMRAGSCFIEGSLAGYDQANCLKTFTSKKNVLLLGDSHAAALWWGLKESFPNLNIMQATVASCHPFKGKYGRSPCSQMRRFLYEEYLPIHPVDAVVLSVRWASYDDLVVLEPAIDWFRQRNIPVIVVGPIPEYTAPLPFLLALGEKWNDADLASRNRVVRLQALDQEFESALQGKTGVRYVSAWRVICPNGQCQVYTGNSGRTPLLADVDHLTNEGSLETIGKLKALGELSF